MKTGSKTEDDLAKEAEGKSSKIVLPLSYGVDIKTDATHPEWQWKLYERGDGKRYLYHAHELSEAPDKPVLVVEGEKTAEAAIERFPDFVVTTWSGGTNGVDKADWESLKGREVVVWSDNDAAGINAAEAVREHCHAVGCRAEIVDLSFSAAELPHKWDLADPLPEGIQPKDLQHKIDQALGYKVAAQERPATKTLQQQLKDIQDFTESARSKGGKKDLQQQLRDIEEFIRAAKPGRNPKPLDQQLKDIREFTESLHAKPSTKDLQQQLDDIQKLTDVSPSRDNTKNIETQLQEIEAFLQSVKSRPTQKTVSQAVSKENDFGLDLE